MPLLQKIVKTVQKLFKKQCVICLWLVILISSHLIAIPAAYSAEAVDTGRAGVVVDGRLLFNVEPSQAYTAQERATQANRQLFLLANLNKETTVEVLERNQQPTIVANGQYLLTVTNLDTTLDKTPSEQAAEWANQIELALQQSRIEREPDYIKYSAWLTGLAVLLAIALHWGIGYFWRHPLRRTIRQAVPKIPKTGMPGAQDFHFLMEAKLAIVRLVIWVSFGWFVSSLFPTLRQRRYTLINSSTAGIRAPLVSVGGQAYTLIDVLILLGLIWGLFILIQLSTKVLDTQILRRMQLARGAKEVVKQTYRYSAFALGLLIILQAWGIDLRSVALLGSAFGIGIGFGFQEIAKNFGSGLVLLFERSIQVGDFIELESHMGIVERIGARSITLRNLDNISVLVPNAHLLGSLVMNWNHDHPVSRLHLPVGVAYGSHTDVVRSALLQVAQEHTEVLPKPSPEVYLNAFGDNAIELDLVVWIRNPERHLEIRSQLYFRIEAMLREQGISIPYPQRDLHLSSGKLLIEFPPGVAEALKTIHRSSTGLG